ncbi:hypothetical protein QBC37DRAFT_289763 [Rhypophila decipiens]|uniref:AN1-type domain-containing protein n=1 Tax=Rhypophila decipiens TaxID=261697 RepID=A0AAN7B625_9PEZI|nr:hypothetical protein QBC37DRAFT_289763 [Rhypophila decipiens]
MPPKRIRCSFNECKLAAQRISGDCAFCNGHYCSNHRLLEDHKCQNLEDVSSAAEDPNTEPQWWLVGLSECKKEAFEQNAMQLNKERTQVIKGV